jgi:hypothetical protein
LALPADSGAAFGRGRTHRYRLWRRWEAGAACCFVLLNPSTADESRNDPTVERCQRRARAWGYPALEVLNLFGLRATDPAELARAPDPVGPANDRFIRRVAGGAGLVVCAWGNRGGLHGRSARVRAVLREAGAGLHHLGLTQQGEPRHPLHLSYDERPRPWP